MRNAFVGVSLRRAQRFEVRDTFRVCPVPCVFPAPMTDNELDRDLLDKMQPRQEVCERGGRGSVCGRVPG